MIFKSFIQRGFNQKLNLMFKTTQRGMVIIKIN